MKQLYKQGLDHPLRDFCVTEQYKRELAYRRLFIGSRTK